MYMHKSKSSSIRSPDFSKPAKSTHPCNIQQWYEIKLQFLSHQTLLASWIITFKKRCWQQTLFVLKLSDFLSRHINKPWNMSKRHLVSVARVPGQNDCIYHCVALSQTEVHWWVLLHISCKLSVIHTLGTVQKITCDIWHPELTEVSEFPCKLIKKLNVSSYYCSIELYDLYNPSRQYQIKKFLKQPIALIYVTSIWLAVYSKL